VKYSRKTRQQFVASESDGKPTGWRAVYQNGRWVQQSGATEDAKPARAPRAEKNAVGKRAPRKRAPN
jgi:DNA topoisomerase-1